MHFLNLALLSAVAVAGPISDTASKRSTIKSVKYLDKFDDLMSDPAGAVTGVLTGGGGVGVYNGLKYAGFTLGSTKLPAVQKQPPSLPNSIFGGILSQTQPEFLPANSSIKYFDLTSLYYSCAVAELNMVGGIADINPSCTIQLSGRKAPQFGGSTAVYELIYDGTLLGGFYNHTSLPSAHFTGLVEVAIAVISSSAVTDLTLPQFDNVAYTAHIQQ